MRPGTLPAALLALGVALGASCTSDNKDEFRAGIEEGFEQAGLDVTDEQVDCVTDSIIEQVGGEERLAELEDEYDSVDDLPEDVQGEFRDAAPPAFEECGVDAAAAAEG